MGEDNVEEYSVGDLIRVHDSVDAELFIFRPPSFPFGKIGLVFEIKTRHDPSYLTPTDVNRYPYIDYEYNKQGVPMLFLKVLMSVNYIFFSYNLHKDVLKYFV